MLKKKYITTKKQTKNRYFIPPKIKKKYRNTSAKPNKNYKNKLITKKI